MLNRLKIITETNMFGTPCGFDFKKDNNPKDKNITVREGSLLGKNYKLQGKNLNKNSLIKYLNKNYNTNLKKETLFKKGSSNKDIDSVIADILYKGLYGEKQIVHNLEGPFINQNYIYSANQALDYVNSAVITFEELDDKQLNAAFEALSKYCVYSIQFRNFWNVGLYGIVLQELAEKNKNNPNKLNLINNRLEELTQNLHKGRNGDYPYYLTVPTKTNLKTRIEDALENRNVSPNSSAVRRDDRTFK